MKARLVISLAILSLGAFTSTAFCQGTDGKAGFDKHCASCHPKGGNVVNPQKTLGKKVMAANGIKTAKDVVAKMRNPGPGMTKFDAKALPEKEATAIAQYILKTFP